MTGTVWGHSSVHVVKDEEKKCWHVYTVAKPRQLLVTIPWTDAYRVIKYEHAPDYVEALNACRLDDRTDLTFEEEDELIASMAAAENQPTSPPPPRSPAEKPRPAEKQPPAPSNVFSLDAFRSRKKR